MVLDSIIEVGEELKAREDELLPMTINENIVLAEITSVLVEVRRMARRLEADRKLMMSRTPLLFRELQETLLVMGGEIFQNSQSLYIKNSQIDIIYTSNN